MKTIHNAPWDLAILEALKKQGNLKHLSEYELYMTYLTEFYTKKFRFISNANITVYRDFLDKLPTLIQAYAAQYKSVSLHHFVLFEKQDSQVENTGPAK